MEALVFWLIRVCSRWVIAATFNRNPELLTGRTELEPQHTRTFMLFSCVEKGVSFPNPIACAKSCSAHSQLSFRISRTPRFSETKATSQQIHDVTPTTTTDHSERKIFSSPRQNPGCKKKKPHGKALSMTLKATFPSRINVDDNHFTP